MYAPPVPTVSIGNLCLGGSGKSPHTEFLIRHFQERYTLATLSRGYGRKTRGFLLANALPPNRLTAAEIGDEPLQFFKKFPNIQVAVCEARREGIENLVALPSPPNLVLLDDAYQHLRVQRDCNILLTDYARPYYDDFPVPAGRLREFAVAARAADLIIVTKSPTALSKEERAKIIGKIKPTERQQVFFSSIQYTDYQAVTEIAKSFPLTKETPIALIAGIANPKPLLTHLREQFENVTLHAFRDHHQFSEQEIAEIVAQYPQGTAFFATEKDCMRLLTCETKKIVSLQPFFSAPIEVKILFNEEQLLIEKIEKYVTKN